MYKIFGPSPPMINDPKKDTIEEITYDPYSIQSSYNPVAILPEGINSRTTDIIIDEFIRKIKTLEGNKIFVPDPNTDAFFIEFNKHVQFNLNYFLKFRQDNLHAKRLKYQLQLLKDYYVTTLETIEKYLTYISDDISIDFALDMFNNTGNLTINNLISDQIKQIIKNAPINIDLKINSKEKRCILKLIKQKKKNLSLIKEIQANVISIIKDGEDLDEFIKITQKVLK